MWRDVSLLPSLWCKADLNYVKEKYRNDLRIHWLILNRLVQCQDLNMGERKNTSETLKFRLLYEFFIKLSVFRRMESSWYSVLSRGAVRTLHTIKGIELVRVERNYPRPFKVPHDGEQKAGTPRFVVYQCKFSTESNYYV